MPYVFNVVSNRRKKESDFLAAYNVPITARASRADVNVEIISLARYSNRSTTKAILFDKFKFVYIVKLGTIDFLPLVNSDVTFTQSREIGSVEKYVTQVLWSRSSSTERLKACKLPTLHYRHIRGDMIEMYKILSGKYDTAVIQRVNREYSSITRGNDLRLQKN